LDPASKVEGNQDIHKRTLEFKDKSSEKAYREYRYENIFKKFRVILFINTSMFILQTIQQILKDETQGMDDNLEIFF